MSIIDPPDIECYSNGPPPLEMRCYGTYEGDTRSLSLKPWWFYVAGGIVLTSLAYKLGGPTGLAVVDAIGVAGIGADLGLQLVRHWNAGSRDRSRDADDDGAGRDGADPTSSEWNLGDAGTKPPRTRRVRRWL